MAESARLSKRNGDIWRWFCRGMSQPELAEHFGISQQRVSQIINDVRDSIPLPAREDLLKEETDFLRGMRVELLHVFDRDPMPVTAGADGHIVEGAEDHSGRLAAASLIERYTKQLHRITGIEASQKIDLNTGEEAAAQKAAAEAASYLHGGEAKE